MPSTRILARTQTRPPSRSRTRSLGRSRSRSLGRTCLVRRRRTAASPAGRALVLLLPALWSGTVILLAFLVPGRVHVAQLLAATPAIACSASGRPWFVLIGGACALGALLPLTDTGHPVNFEVQFGHVLAIVSVSCASYLVTGRRARLARELDLVRAVAETAQLALLRPLPSRLGSLRLAADYLSASRGARIGGDLYEALATPHGIRVIIGDVRGHGMAAVGTVVALLGCFREAAYEEPALGGVVRRLDRALARHLREPARSGAPAEAGGRGADPKAEEFATVLLLELGPGNRLSVLSCGHPWPYLIDAAPGAVPWVRPLAAGEPLPPLGVLGGVLGEVPPNRTAYQTRLLPGQTLLLHTDGVAEARDRSGAFFPLGRMLRGAAARQTAADGDLDPALLLRTLRAELIRHAGGRPADDVALLALARDRVPLPGVPGDAPCPLAAEAPR